MNAKVSAKWFSACALGCLVLAGFGSGGCQQTPTVTLAVAPRASAGTKPADIVFWSMADGGMLVENTLRRPIAILNVELRTGGNSLVARDGSETVAAEITDDGATVEGTLMTEDIGPAARRPSPDRWRWKGTGKLVHFPVLRPGQTFSISGSFRVTDKTGHRVSASLRYAELTDLTGLLVLGPGSMKSLPRPPGGAFGKGWIATYRKTVTFRKADKLAKFPHRKSALSSYGRIMAMPSHYPHALAKSKFDALADNGKLVRARDTFEVVGPPIALSGAREIAKVATGPYTYCPQRSAWVIEGDGVTHFVGKTSRKAIPGRLVRLAEKLTSAKSVEIQVFTGAKAKDPDGHVAFLVEKGFNAKSQLQKGGTYRGSVVVKRSELDKFVDVLSKRGLRVEGLAVR